MTRKLAIGFSLLLASLAADPVSTSALPTDTLDIDAIDTVRGVEAPSMSSVLGSPAAPATKVAAPAPAVPEHASGANPLWAIPLATLSNTRERPIFSSSRRPPAMATASIDAAKALPPKPREPERPPLSLVGTISGADEGFGIFVDQGTKAALRLKIGDDYQGWKLHEVHGREVMLQKNERTAVLSLPQPAAGGEVRVQQPVMQESALSPAERERNRRH